VRHQSATATELARIAELAEVPGEALTRLGEQMERRDLAPGQTLEAGGRFGVVLAGMARGSSGLLRPGDTFDSNVTALTPMTVASCERAVFESILSEKD
jgi:CRP-like cAMP-binding protein